MKTSLWTRVFEIFRAAVELDGPGRARLLEERCGADGELRRQVERMLDEDSRAGPLDETPAVAVSELWPAESGPVLDGRVGSYSIRRVIASGGMGTVYEAEQASPQRTVALKTLRSTGGSGEGLRRFQLEAQILGTLQHPGIAQVFDSGLHGEGERAVPYIAMEYVRGARDVLAFARERRLPVPERLRLFLEVCDAVHHGHQRGVIHRDLKPSNLLVDERGAPKVIDFGMARVTEPERFAVTAPHTATGRAGGTLLYMSPEQLAGHADAVDTRSDVYALGVVLFQLVAGSHPFDVEGLGFAGTVEALTKGEPRRLGSVAPALAGELDWITAKAIDRDPARRYGSVSELAADVRRHLAHEPVLAAEPSGWYRFRKLVRRHRVRFGFAAVLGAVFVAGLAATLWQAGEARNRAEEALAAQGAAEREARRAEREARTAQLVNRFYNTLFGSVNAYKDGREVRVVDLLERGVGRLPSVDDPLVRAIVQGDVGECFLNLAELERARDLVSGARESMAGLVPASSPYLLHLDAVWADFLEQAQRMDECRAVAERSLPVAEEALGADHPTARYLRASLATVEQKVGHPRRAEELWRRNLEGWERELGAESETALDLRHKVGVTLNAQGRHSEARDWLEDTVARQEAVVGRSLATLATMLDLATAEWELGDLARAEELLREVYAGQRALGAPPNNLCGSANNLAAVLLVQGKDEEAMEIFEEVELLVDRLWSPPSLGHVTLHANRAAILRDLGDFGAATEQSRLALEMAAHVFPWDHPQYAYCIGSLMQSLRPLGRGAEAEELLLEHLARLERERGPSHPSALETLSYVVERRHLDGLLEAAEDAALLLVERTPADSDARPERERLLEEIRAERATAERP